MVRRYRPSDLLPALAELSVAGGQPPYEGTMLTRVPPWATAVAARESILWGNEHRHAEVTGESLRLVINAFNSIAGINVGTDHTDVTDVIIRHAYEQFPYQESIFEEVSRSHALMVEGAREVDVEVLDEAAWDRLLGAPLGQVVGATFFLQAMADHNNGWFDHALLDREDFQAFYDRWPRSVIEERAAQLSSTFDEFKDAHRAVPHPPKGHERYAYNPLARRPFIRMPDGRLLAPQPRLIMRTVSPGALYYLGMEEFGQAFSRDLGNLTEHYVGKQLRAVEPIPEVHPEITYRVGRSEKKSTDWFMVLPSVVVMFEVKSARFGLLERAGFGGYKEKVRTLLNRAIAQLRRSSEELDNQNALFNHIPNDPPRVGVVVTGEPYYMANAPWTRDLLDDAPFPTLTASLRDIEFLAGLPLEEVEKQLVLIANDPDRSTWNLGNALDAAKGTVSPVLQRAWDSYPWPEVLDEDDE